MGIYLNPGSSGFEEILRSEYVDKTGLIELVNQTIGTKRKLTCISRPRRFGKSFAAQMLCAYYDCTCDSRELFRDKAIANADDYLERLNQYHVICLDITTFISEVRKHDSCSLREIPHMIEKALIKDLAFLYPDSRRDEAENLGESLLRLVEQTGRKIVFVIDEWDALIREARMDKETQSAYLNLLRGWFKNLNFTPKVVAAAYMTGILPIKKDGTQSAISDFVEYSIMNPGRFTEYTGFTEREVRDLCQEHGISFEEMKRWYDGYEFAKVGAIYNPYSVMQAIHDRRFDSYWQKTSAAEALITYVNMDFEGLREIISRLIAGEKIEIDTSLFENDFESFRSKDDVLTLLIHLGYLAWDDEEKTAHVPNEEIRTQFRGILKGVAVNSGWLNLLNRSKKLLERTISGDADAVGSAIEDIRNTQYAPTFYNDEQALRYVIKFAYLAAIDQYLKVEEL